MRLKVRVTGLVQGVGFRPFVHRLALGAGLKGYVFNDMSGVTVEVEGEKGQLDEFLIKIDREKPSVARIYSLQHAFMEDAGFKDFEIRESEERGDKRASVLPDIAVCDDCLNDVINPKDRRFIYPFTNCTNCGPRFTIIQSLPYDRKNTSMKAFQMCPDCENEYNLPDDRRFHAQPDACRKCGPWLSLYDNDAKLLCEKDDALEKAVSQIRNGNIVAIKGIGGYHLVCDAANEDAVSRLRKRKHRDEKPMAVMFPNIDDIKKEADISPLEERAILSVERPIVIVRKKETTGLASSVSPGNESVGVYLPYTPLHYLILRKLKKPVVATSANLTDEPIAKDEADAFERLSRIADHFLSHNRDIVRRCDDSVVRIAAERQAPVRRSRGFAPVPVLVPFRFDKPVLALGTHMNNTIAAGIEDKVFLSQHIGDLDTPRAVEFYEETINDFLRLFGIRPKIVISDLHPGYYSTKHGERYFKSRLVKVQHHYAHILSCMIENDVPENAEVIGFAFDGTGYGTDKIIWGSEVLIANYKEFKRAFHLRPFRLIGGEKAVKEPRRTAFSLLFESFGDEAMRLDNTAVDKQERSFFLNMLKKNINSPLTTSMGRLFDGVSSVIGLKHKVSYHAQAAVMLEQCALRSGETGSYPFIIKDGIIDQRPVIENIMKDIRSETAKETIARKFHNTIIEIIINISESLREETGIAVVALSGGVFQNTILLEGAFHRLKERGFTPLMHQLVPANDGGISLGQAVYARFLNRLTTEGTES